MLQGQSTLLIGINMHSAVIQVRHVETPAHLRVTCSAEKAPECRPLNVMGIRCSIELPDSSPVAEAAVKAAAISGALFTLEKIRHAGYDSNYHFSLNEATGTLDSMDLTIISIMTGICVAQITGFVEFAAELDLSGWILEEMDVL